MNPMVSFRASISFAASCCRVNTAEKSMEGGGVSAPWEKIHNHWDQIISRAVAYQRESASDCGSATSL